VVGTTCFIIGKCTLGIITNIPALMSRRWQGDPATTRPVVHRQTTHVPGGSQGGEEELDDDVEYADPPAPINGVNGNTPNRTTQATPLSTSYMHRPPSPPSPMLAGSSGAHQHQHIGHPQGYPPHPPPDFSQVNLPLPSNVINAFLQFLQAQSQTTKLKLDYLRRREEREEQDSKQRRELEKVRTEREAAEWEHTKQTAKVKHRSELATELLNNPTTDASMRQTAMDYLKRLLTE
jgi:hypothetical protein